MTTTLRRKQREWWKSEEAWDLYWGDPMFQWHTVGVEPEGPGFYYAPMVETAVVGAEVAHFRPIDERGKVRRFAHTWKRWRDLGETPEARRQTPLVRRRLDPNDYHADRQDPTPALCVYYQHPQPPRPPKPPR